MKNWYKTSQTVTNETAMTERMNMVSNLLKTEIFPKFVNDVGRTTMTEINRLIDQKIVNYARDIPDILQLENYNPEPMKDILRTLASRTASVVLQNQQANAWNFISRDQTALQQYVVDFFRTVYTPSQEELESFKLTMLQK